MVRMTATIQKKTTAAARWLTIILTPFSLAVEDGLASWSCSCHRLQSENPQAVQSPEGSNEREQRAETG